MSSDRMDELVNTLTTVGDYVRWSMSQFAATDAFCGHGYGDAWDESLALVFHGAGLPWDANPALLNTTLLMDERRFIVERVHLRTVERMPLAYITNKAYFCGLEFYVDERVLIPRSPIGELIENQFMGLMDYPPERIADVCAGSGCIGIAMAMAFDGAQVDITDISADALAVATMNVERHGLQDHVQVHEGNLLEPLPADTYDLIVSNPPYVDAGDMASRPREFTHEPELGLAGGDDGLDLVHTMLPQAAARIAPEGVFVCEVGNSWPALEAAYPDLPFVWVEFERGGDGVFALSGQVLRDYFLTQP